jgi:hypothetical protein
VWKEGRKVFPNLMEPSVPRISSTLSFFVHAVLINLMTESVKLLEETRRGKKRKTEDFIRKLKWVRNCVYSFNLSQGM